MASLWDAIFHFHAGSAPFGPPQAPRSPIRDAFGQYLDAPDRARAASDMIMHLRDVSTRAASILRASQRPRQLVCTLKCHAWKHRDDPVLSVLAIAFQLAEISLAVLPSAPQYSHSDPQYSHSGPQYSHSDSQHEDTRPSAPPYVPGSAPEILRRLDQLDRELKDMRALVSRI